MQQPFESKDRNAKRSADPQLFFNKRLKNRHIPVQIKQFVIIPTEPQVCLKNKKPCLTEETSELLEMAESTLDCLIKDRQPRVCPRVIFTTTDTKWRVHQLETYAPQMISEQTHSHIFHIVGHSDPSGVGVSDPFKRLSIESFAQSMIEIFSQPMFTAFNLMSRPLTFVFHSCNSAYCDIHSNMYDSEIKNRLLKHSLIGKFYTYLKMAGFRQLQVSGFRGYYAHTTSHSGSVVFGSDPHETILAERCQFTIQDGQHGIPEISMPGDPKYRFLPVIGVEESEALSELTIQTLSEGLTRSLTI